MKPITPQETEKNCFTTFSIERIENGLCDCHNRFKELELKPKQ